MRSQDKQSAQHPDDREHGRDKDNRQRMEGGGSESGRPYPRSVPETYPESHYQYQAQRDHPGSEYFSGTPTYGDRGYQQQQGQEGYGSSQQGQGGGWPRNDFERRGQGGSFRQQQAYQAEGRQQGFGGEDFGRGGYGSYGAYQTGSQPEGGRNRGPKGYQRSDERIRELICEILVQRSYIDASDVSVEVNLGRVILEGTVPQRRMKHEIEDVADSCWGVKDVENRIRVRSGQQGAESGGASPGAPGPSTAPSASSAMTTNLADMSPVETSGGGSQGSARRMAGEGEKDKGKEQQNR
ncbi:MAG: hypothetical protein H6R10_1515 [Rhodocyclaceae bacterium]|nr:hypothetical protein [Rhodocyclaceae bacterium]